MREGAASWRDHSSTRTHLPLGSCEWPCFQASSALSQMSRNFSSPGLPQTSLFLKIGSSRLPAYHLYLPVFIIPSPSAPSVTPRTSQEAACLSISPGLGVPHRHQHGCGSRHGAGSQLTGCGDGPGEQRRAGA